MMSFTTLKRTYYLIFVGVIEFGPRCLKNGEVFLFSFTFIEGANYVNVPGFQPVLFPSKYPYPEKLMFMFVLSY